MPAFSLTPVQGFPETTSQEFPNPLLFSLDDVMFNGPIQIVNFVGGTVTERETGILDVTLGGGGGTTPGGSNRQLQFNDDGAFGGTARNNVLLTFPASGDYYLSLNDVLNVRDAILSPTNFEITQLASLGAGKQHMAAVSSHFVSTIPFPPSGGFVSNDQAMLFVSGGRSEIDGDDGLGGAWMTPQGFHFEDYATGRETRYVDIMPMERPLLSILVPETFPNAIQVVIGDTFYWLPLIEQ